MTNHPECSHHSSIQTSNLAPHFGFPDIQARITLIPRSILATLTFDPSRLIRALIELQVLYDGIAGNPHLGEAYRRGMDEINALQFNLYLGDRINPDTLNKIHGSIEELF
ncbi:MAG: hypothetical protein IPL99_08525 [Candidatus Competibacteraceae bacterium]|nr:hypothetical protein [Candidatus Competibacteraceae bacterium]